MKKRVHFWDNYKGILIFLVVLGHFIYSYAKNLSGSLAHDIYFFIYSFHMPAFIFCSGYFSKSEHSRSKESLVKLFVYYVFFNTLMLFFDYFYVGSSINMLSPYYSYWYILSLIAWRALVGKVGNIKGIVLLSVFISLLLGYSKEFTNLLSLRRTVAFFPFFLAGYQLDVQKVEQFLTKRKPWHMFLSGVLVLAVAVVCFKIVDHSELTSSATLMGTYSKTSTLEHRLLIFSVSIAAIIGMFLTVPNCRIPILGKIGKNSLLIYLVHRFVAIVYYKDLFPRKTYSEIYILYALIATVILCIVLSSDRLNQAVAKACEKVAGMLTSSEYKSHNPALLAIVCIFLGLLALKASPEISEKYLSAWESKNPKEVIVEETKAATQPTQEDTELAATEGKN